MAQAVAEKREKKNAVDNLVDEFHKEYEAAWRDLEIMRDTTRTDGWKLFYQHERQQQREQRQQIAKSLSFHTAAFAAGTSSEGMEKELGDIKKDELALREQVEAWTARVVEPFRAVVEDCNNLLSGYMSKARSMASDSPLLHKDAELDMREAQRTVGRATWNDEDGTIDVK